MNNDMKFEWDGVIDYIGDEEFMVRVCYTNGDCDNLTFPNSVVKEADLEYFDSGANVCKLVGKEDISFYGKHPKHSLTVNGIPVDMLARKVANLRYDALEDFLKNLRQCFLEDSLKDRERGYKRVSKYLSSMSNLTKDVEFKCGKLWKICKDKMDIKNEIQ